MMFQKFIGLRACLCNPSCTALAAVGLAAAASLFVAPHADAQFKEQYNTNFDNRFYEFDPLRERVTGPAGRGQAPLVLSREDVIELVQNDPTTFFFDGRDSLVSGIGLTPFRSPPLVLEEDEVVTTPAGISAPRTGARAEFSSTA